MPDDPSALIEKKNAIASLTDCLREVDHHPEGNRTKMLKKVRRRSLIPDELPFEKLDFMAEARLQRAVDLNARDKSPLVGCDDIEGRSVLLDEPVVDPDHAFAQPS